LRTAAVNQFGAHSGNYSGRPLRRYAQEILPKSQSFFDYAKRLSDGR
jgi:hypothetical protein